MASGIRLGVLVLPEHTGPARVNVWQRVEELGFTHAWTLDHLSWRTLRGRPWFDSMTTLAEAAARTSRLVLGTLVTTPNFRHPVLTAAQAMTLDHISGGRFVLGVGAGAAGPDNTALGAPDLPPAERGARFAEFVRLLDVLLRQPETTFSGRYFSADQVPMVPGCVQQPRLPFAVAAAGPRGMKLAAELAGFWVTIGNTTMPGRQQENAALATLRAQVDRLAWACEQVGRAQPSLRKLVNLSRVVPDPYTSPERLADLLGQCERLGFTDAVLAYPRADGVFAGDLTAFDRAVTPLLGKGES